MLPGIVVTKYVKDSQRVDWGAIWKKRNWHKRSATSRTESSHHFRYIKTRNGETEIEKLKKIREYLCQTPQKKEENQENRQPEEYKQSVTIDLMPTDTTKPLCRNRISLRELTSFSRQNKTPSLDIRLRKCRI